MRQRIPCLFFLPLDWEYLSANLGPGRIRWCDYCDIDADQPGAPSSPIMQHPGITIWRLLERSMSEAMQCGIAGRCGALGLAFDLDRGHLARLDVLHVRRGIDLPPDVASADVSCSA